MNDYKSFKVRIKRLSLLYALLISLVLALGITYFLASTRVLSSNKKENAITIFTPDEKNPSSWGNEIRIYYILVNGENVDFNHMNLPEGWELQEPFLFYNGSGSELSIVWNEIITDIKVRYCKQMGSGIMVIENDETELGRTDLYDEEWVQGEVAYHLITRIDLLGFFVGYLIVFTFLFYLIIVAYKKKPHDVTCDNSKSIHQENSLGMFDLIRGIGILSVIGIHSIEVFDTSIASDIMVSLVTIPYTIFEYGIMPAFFLASGYGLKIKKVLSAVKTNLRFMGKPYLCVGILTCIITALVQILRQQPILESVIYKGAPFLLARFTDGQFFSFPTGHLGPMWFFVTLFMGTIMVTILFKIKSPWVRNLLMVVIYILSLLGYSALWIPVWMTRTGMYMAYIYVGYLMKKTKWLWKTSVQKTLILCGITLYVIVMVVLYTLIPKDNIWQINVLAQTIAACSGMIVIQIFIWLNQFENFIFDKIRVIGRYTLWILCIHSLEYLCYDWVGFGIYFKEIPKIGMLLAFLGRLMFALVGCYLLYRWNRRKGAYNGRN